MCSVGVFLRKSNPPRTVESAADHYRTSFTVMMMTCARCGTALLYVGLLLSVVPRTEAQAPGDGDQICTDEVVNGMPNPFFALRPTYSPNERPLMDSRDYVGLLQGGDNLPWQTVDNDDNNTAGVATAVSFFIN